MEFRTINAGNNYPRIGLSLANAASNGGGGSSNLDFTNQGYQPAFLFEAGSENNGSNCKNGGESAEKTGRAKFGTVSYTNTGTSGGSNIFAFALDLDNRKLFISKDGTYFNSGDPANGTNPQIAWTTTPSEFIHIWADAYQTATQIIANWGQDSTFSGNETAGGNADENGFGDFKYSPPTGFLAMCSANLPISDDIDPAQTDDNFPQKNFNAILYTGTGSSNAISGLGFQPDLVWLKQRGSSGSNMLLDTNRGTNARLSANNTNEERTASSYFTSFDSDGFTVTGNDSISNASSGTFVGWCWRANGGTTASNSDGSITSTVQTNPAKNFSIITYTGTGSNATIGHGMTKKPAFIIVKNRTDVDSWAIYHESMTADFYTSFQYSIFSNNATFWNDTEPTTSVISIGTNNRVNGSSDSLVCYAWAQEEGFQKFETYIGNGNADGPFIYTGFRPRLIYIKKNANSSYWHVFDTARNVNNTVDTYLLWDSSGADDTASSNSIEFFSNGFKVKNNASQLNASGSTYVFGAWGDVPFKYNNTF